MSLELELVEFVKGIPEFYAPIATGLLVSYPAQSILDRMTYNQADQDAAKPSLKTNQIVPFVYWQGPGNTDLGQHANGLSGTAKEDFWFYFNHGSMTAAMAWANTVSAAIIAKMVANPCVNLITLRVTAAIFLDKRPVIKDMQTLLTAQEFPVSQAMLGFTFGYQPVSN